jgi:hypothetical protein
MNRINLVLLILLATSSFAQQIYIEGGKTLSSFDYKNSQGERLENLQATPHSFMSVGYRNQIFTKNLNLSLGLSYTGYGAVGSDDNVGNYFKWDTNYFEINTGLDYEIFKINKFIFYLKGTASAAFLLQGTQILNKRVIDLKNQDDFDQTVFDFRAGFGVLHPISNNLSFYLEYMHGRSLKLRQGTAVTDDQETLRYVSENVSFGLLINISQKIIHEKSYN